MLDPLRFSTGIVSAVAFQQIDPAENTQSSAQCDDYGTQYGYSFRKYIHGNLHFR